MRTILATLALAMPLLAQAAIPDVHTSTLDITAIDDHRDSNALIILNAQHGVVKLTTAEWQTIHNVTTSGNDFPDVKDYQLSMTLAPAAGYIITGYSISATVSGTLDIPAKPPQANSTWTPGMATNVAEIYLPDGKGGSTVKKINDVTTPAVFEYSIQGLSIDHATSLWFDTFAGAYAANGRWSDMYGDYRAIASSHISVSAPSLTIYTALAPVPEPETWGMLLAGIALIGVAKRRSKVSVNPAPT